MRLSSATLPLSALLASACASGPDTDQKKAAQTELSNCLQREKKDIAGQPPLTEEEKKSPLKRYASSLTGVSSVLGGLDAEKIVKQDKPDFSISGSVAPYMLESKDGDKTVKSKMNVTITFKSVGGIESANISGSKITMADGDKIGRNDPFYSENIPAETENFQGINVAGMLKEGRACAIGAQAKLGL